MSLRDRLLSPPRRLIGASFLVDLYVAVIGLAVQNLGDYGLHAPNYALGLLASFSAITYALGCLISGSISDRLGRKRLAVVGCVGAGIAWLLIPNVGGWRAVLCVLPLSGVSLSLFWPSIQAWLAELSGDRRELSRTLGLFNVLWCAGLMCGPVVSAYLWGAGHQLAFWVPGVLMLAMVGFLLAIPLPAQGGAAPGEEERADHEDSDLFLKLAWLGNFASFFALGVIGGFFPKLGHELGFSVPFVGWTLFASRGGQLLVFLVTRYKHGWQYRVAPMMALQVTALAGMMLARLTSTGALFALGFGLAGASAGMTYVASLFYSLHGRSQGKGRTSGFHEAVLGGGGFLGPLLGAVVAQLVNLRAPFVLAAAVLAAACLFQGVMVASRRRPPNSEPSVGGPP